eukprot:CAMPEP_0170581010 /NCGR_PEP_ID=MMETSP0224-20130122/6812_1 /TAXON_ID=285029 /ORGANISM="Togula jolla, Strain CCCM 725" /LENGTH=83 /DNA_ID=CAMNT_0010904119 /DNA_START=267 /DNA_END=518 /DNA_ORIENTATION=-
MTSTTRDGLPAIADTVLLQGLAAQPGNVVGKDSGGCSGEQTVASSGKLGNGRLQSGAGTGTSIQSFASSGSSFKDQRGDMSPA